MPIILITGAAGGVGSMLRARLARPGRTLRLLDIAPLTAGPGEEAVSASITDLDAMTEACRNVTAVVHLAGIPGVTVTATWVGRDGTAGTADDRTWTDRTDGTGAYRFDEIGRAHV